jgi:lysophospholipid acyltransferase
MKDKVEKWNISIQTWLRRYVYTRIATEEEMKKSVAK